MASSAPHRDRPDPTAQGLDREALAALAARLGPLAVVDLETTGLADDPRAEILEVGALLVEPGGELGTFASGVRPRGPVPPFVTRLTGLRAGDLADAPRIEALAPLVAEALAGRALVAHNAAFERTFLTREVAPALDAAVWLDSQEILALTHPDAPDLRLETLGRALLAREERHRALADALDLAAVLCALARGARAGERRYAVARDALERFAPDSPWLALLPVPGVPARARARGHYVAIPPSREPPVPFDEDAIVAALADAERGRRHLPGYRVRSGQLELARAAVRALDAGGTLLLEGGTGVGKSLAYLAAAIPFALERAAGGVRQPVVISTRTKLLQDQLLEKDIPAAAALLGHPELRAISIKGRANYLCQRRLQEVLAEGSEPGLFAEDRLAFSALLACAGTRPHGEIAGLPGALLHRFPLLRDLLRRAVAVRAEQCTRELCAAERSCPFGRRRAALADAHLVVANHDLLLRWPPDYPAFTHVIADEAHELAGVADEVYADEVRAEELLLRVDELVGRPETGRGRRGVAAPRALLPELAEPVRTLRRALREELTLLGSALAERAGEFGELELPAFPERLLPEACARAQGAAEQLEELAAAVEAHDLGDDPRAEPVERVVAELRAGAAGLRAAFLAPSAENVAALEGLLAPFDRWRLAIRAVAPADAFHEHFADRLESLICVSATLFVAGDPLAALGELELERRAKPARLRVESPFPYPAHMRVAALDPEEDLVRETAWVLAELARRLGGRTLGLFTSLRRMREVADLLAAELRDTGISVLLPRRVRDDPVALVQRFARDPGTVLLGARTFWQGIDVPGEALQAVVIEKLPFEVPTELRRRRAARLRAQGEDDFERYTLGKMLLHLRQMTGRLIRSEEDRGIAVIVEGRTRRDYFRRLGEALPDGSGIERAGRDDLARLLAEVGIGSGPRSS